MATLRISASDTLGALEADFRKMPKVYVYEANRSARDVAHRGRRAARTSAKVTAGSHGKHYPNAITVERVGPTAYEYGPESGLPQGGMSFEYGSRNQRPHRDIDKSVSGLGFRLQHDGRGIINKLVWPR